MKNHLLQIMAIIILGSQAADANFTPYTCSQLFRSNGPGMIQIYIHTLHRDKERISDAARFEIEKLAKPGQGWDPINPALTIAIVDAVNDHRRDNPTGDHQRNTPGRDIISARVKGLLASSREFGHLGSNGIEKLANILFRTFNPSTLGTKHLLYSLLHETGGSQSPELYSALVRIQNNYVLRLREIQRRDDALIQANNVAGEVPTLKELYAIRDQLKEAVQKSQNIPSQDVAQMLSVTGNREAQVLKAKLGNMEEAFKILMLPSVLN